MTNVNNKFETPYIQNIMDLIFSNTRNEKKNPDKFLIQFKPFKKNSYQKYIYFTL